MVSATSTGLAGEYIAAAMLLSLGYRVALASQDRVDLVCWHPDDGQILRVQVKSATLNIGYGRTFGRSANYHFQLATGARKERLPNVKDFDLIVLVGIDHRRCIAFATEQVQQATKRVIAKRFDNPQVEYETMAKAIEIIKARK